MRVLGACLALLILHFIPSSPSFSDLSGSEHRTGSIESLEHAYASKRLDKNMIRTKDESRVWAKVYCHSIDTVTPREALETMKKALLLVHVQTSMIACEQ